MKVAQSFYHRCLALVSILMLSGLSTEAQWLPFQTVKVEYDVRGNRIVRKLYDPNGMETKVLSEEEQFLKEDGMTVYPNPARDEVTLQLTAADVQTMDITIYNATGQQVATSTLQPGNTITTFDLRGLPPGIYHIQATTATRKRSFTIIHQ